MSLLIEEALKLSKEEKVKLYYALQEDLNLDDNFLFENELSAEQWTELNKRVKDAETGEAELLTLDLFKEKLAGKIDELGNSSQ